jgi:hypothetical protein
MGVTTFDFLSIDIDLLVLNGLRVLFRDRKSINFGTMALDSQLLQHIVKIWAKKNHKKDTALEPDV